MELRKDFSMFHMPDLGTGLPEKPLQQVEESAKKAASALEQAYEDMRKFKELISGMENGKLPFNQEDLTRYIQGYDNAKKVVDDFKKSLSNEGKKVTFMRDMLPELIELGEGLEKLAHKFEEISEKGEKLFEFLIKPLEHVAEEYKEKFENMKKMIDDAVTSINKKYGKNTAVLTVTDSYYNMIEMIRPHMHLIESAKNAIRSAGMEPEEMPIRGGTDGARLSFMGLPCPNLGTGGFNFHGPFECITVERMEKAVSVIETLMCQLSAV